MIMTLDDVIKTAVEQKYGVELQSEKPCGVANVVDFCGVIENDCQLLVELERRREDPVNNVVKQWRQAHESGYQSAFRLIQVFSGFYQRKLSKRQNAEFIGDRMNEWAQSHSKDICYYSVSFGFEPQASNSHSMLEEAIETCIRKELLAQLPELP